ncbi:MAG: fasciclin domain-containing protein [Armatimonadota bacterium]|nr:fasciclin domain-containing protein [Armatimonadota bacterium]MDR7453311.1 fasciclin domain-containing protein [Armatimonadota bacterium]MDR7456489.1 fasciclin domain-containing protein [Armatimonadota bacterium]MDR7496244.1 fasciclin domain-containing protein [Armatimonadota bacterium]MDR7512399.1 fasciclin domain-containing protein [Armatimonadota bacterium]
MQVSSTFRTLVLSLAVAAMSLTAPGTARAQAPAQNVVEALRAAGTFGRFLQAVEQAGLTAALTAEQVTVLAPTDEAFAQIPQATLENREQLISILRNHIVVPFLLAAGAGHKGIGAPRWNIREQNGLSPDRNPARMRRCPRRPSAAASCSPTSPAIPPT